MKPKAKTSGHFRSFWRQRISHCHTLFICFQFNGTKRDRHIPDSNAHSLLELSQKTEALVDSASHSHTHTHLWIFILFFSCQHSVTSVSAFCRTGESQCGGWINPIIFHDAFITPKWHQHNSSFYVHVFNVYRELHTAKKKLSSDVACCCLWNRSSLLYTNVEHEPSPVRVETKDLNFRVQCTSLRTFISIILK